MPTSSSCGPIRAGGNEPLRFATVGGLASAAKGAYLLLDAMNALKDLEGRLRLEVYGFVPPAIREAAERVPGVHLRTSFKAGELDAVLDEVDVGIMPSIWEEAYGYVGVEFLAKGIPVIANQIGGMVDYTREGDTGWLNRSCSAAELAGIMRRLVERPASVREVSDRLARRAGGAHQVHLGPRRRDGRGVSRGHGLTTNRPV